MPTLRDFGVLSFDVYGTLIDWEKGMLKALRPILDANESLTSSRLILVFHELEHKQQRATPEMPYSQLLATVHAQLADELGLTIRPTAEESQAFGASVGSWPAFPDTVDALRRLGRHYKLVVLSNVDRASFAGTNSGPLEGVPFDLVLTAQDIGSYKPSPRNFDYMLAEVEWAFGLGKEKVLQTAQSQFHDHHPARAAGIKSCWIVRPGAIQGNRDKEVYDWRFNTLGEMADALDKELEADQGA